MVLLELSRPHIDGRHELLRAACCRSRWAAPRADYTRGRLGVSDGDELHRVVGDARRVQARQHDKRLQPRLLTEEGRRSRH